MQFFSEHAVNKKPEHLARVVSTSMDFAESDVDSEEHGFTDDYESDMQRHRALALEIE